MGWEYQWLKRKLGIPNDELLSGFDRYCEDSHRLPHKMEWSCKVKDRIVYPNRFVHISKVVDSNRLEDRIGQLACSLRLDHSRCPVTSDSWHELLSESEYVYMSYAGPTDSTELAAIKLVIALKAYSPRLHSSIIAQFDGSMDADMPPGNPGVLFGYTLFSDGNSSPRIYLFYDSREYEDPEIRDYVCKLVGKKAFNVLRSYPRSAVSYKKGRTDMLYCSLRDPQSQMKTMVRDVADSCHEIAERIDKLTWIGVPIGEESSDSPSEINIYAEID